MPFTLEIEFGGLCLFVQRNTGVKGLYVLMPRMRHMSSDPDMDHFPTLLFDPEHWDPSCGPAPTPGPTGEIQIRLPDGIPQIDIGNLSHHGSPTRMPAEIAPVSEYARNQAVADRWLQGDPERCLAVRVGLPLGLPITPVGRLAKMKVKVGGADKPEKLAGRATVADIPIGGVKLGIDGTVLIPDRANRMKIRLVNAPQPDIDNPKQHPHKKGETVRHFPAYYTLLSSSCKPPRGAPDLIVDEDVKGDTSRQDEIEAKFVDPFRCTVGFGL